ncbi:MAG TPA: DUF480 domain-containing protein [Acidimicrobiales bacterium]|jgi:uncharacterized protein YceH (UPF0502 family)|nr:DUF480 domain-containing protein [Acidimicrobiales bacterium]
MELSVAEGRVLGCLIEKQVTELDDTYSLTLDELRFSCNQTSGRDPVVAFDDRTVEDTLLSLKAMGLARFVSVNHRIGPTTYRHRADERWRLARPELAVLSILLLRGPQTVEQIWALVEGQVVVDSPTEIEVALDTLAGRTPTPLTARLARSGGPDGVSWVEVLTGRYTLDPPAPVESYDAALLPPSRRGSGLPAREPWRPDERFDSRGRQREPREQRQQSDQRQLADPRPDPRDQNGPRDEREVRNQLVRRDDRDQRESQGPRDQREPQRDQQGRRDEREPRELRGPRDEHDQRERGEAPRPARVDPAVPLAVPANQPPRPAPTLAELADRLTNIERRLAGIEAALGALRSGSGAPAGKQVPPPPPRPQPATPPPAPARPHR